MQLFVIIEFSLQWMFVIQKLGICVWYLYTVAYESIRLLTETFYEYIYEEFILEFRQRCNGYNLETNMKNELLVIGKLQDI